jgi:glycosyltransferase involved in cell wall biosynthesis
MQKLSVVIITLNEERNIGRCLESVKDITDDIVVVDSFSADRTEEICRQYNNLRFISRKWEGYSETKNFANLQAKYDLILSIDADEALSEDLKKSIISINETSDTTFYKFNRMTNYCGRWIKHSGWYPDRKLRIFNRNKAKWTGQIHETPEYDKTINIELLKGDLHHYSYYSISEHIERMNRFTDVSSLELFEKGGKACLFRQIWKTKIKFLSVYFWKLGFLDGYYGFVIAVLSAMSEFVKYGKLRAMKLSSE